jgi:predicted HTH domain antitoxin
MQETFTIEVPRPRTIADLETVRREASDRAYTKAVLDLVGRGELSSAYGAKLLGMNRVDFVECMRQHGIPLADYPAQVLRQEIEDAAQDFIAGETDKG